MSCCGRPSQYTAFLCLFPLHVPQSASPALHPWTGQEILESCCLCLSLQHPTCSNLKKILLLLLGREHSWHSSLPIPSLTLNPSPMGAKRTSPATMGDFNHKYGMFAGQPSLPYISFWTHTYISCFCTTWLPFPARYHGHRHTTTNG